MSREVRSVAAWWLVVLTMVLLGGMGVLMMLYPDVGKKHALGSGLALIRECLPEPWDRRFMRVFGGFMVLSAGFFLYVLLVV